MKKKILIQIKTNYLSQYTLIKDVMLAIFLKHEFILEIQPFQHVFIGLKVTNKLLFFFLILRIRLFIVQNGQNGRKCFSYLVMVTRNHIKYIFS